MEFTTIALNSNCRVISSLLEYEINSETANVRIDVSLLRDSNIVVFESGQCRKQLLFYGALKLSTINFWRIHKGFRQRMKYSNNKVLSFCAHIVALSSIILQMEVRTGSLCFDHLRLGASLPSTK